MIFSSNLINNLSDDDKAFVISHCNEINGEYRNKDGLSVDDLARLVEIKMNYEDCLSHFDTGLIAYYMYVHRTTYHRHGDESDDYFKAVYLYNLNEYLRQKGKPLVLFKTVEMREEAIDMVNNIFDHAFYLKKAHPEYSDLQCFTEAEREFCEEKELDYIAYFESSGNEKIDWENSKKKYKEKLLSEIAYYEYLNRNKHSLPGDDKSDFYSAENKYEDWRMQKRIATLCWNKVSTKYFSKQRYWNLAGDIVRDLKNENHIYTNGNPFADEYVIRKVEEKIKELW